MFTVRGSATRRNTGPVWGVGRVLPLIIAFGLLLAGCPEAEPEVEVEPEEPDAEPEEPEEEPVDEVDDGEEVVFFSTQLEPVEEAEAMRNTILADFPAPVDFVGSDYGPWSSRVQSEFEADSGTVDLLGALHGDYAAVGTEPLADLSDLMDELADRGFASEYMELARLGTDATYYIPWMQATYIVVANRQALDHLPDGADVEALTYDDYLAWARNLHEATGGPMVGFPAGEGGLMHRFFQGYLIPAYRGGLVTTFTSDGAVEGWEYLAELWGFVHPQSTVYDFMQEPLLGEEVWVAWDHVARLIDAVEERPDDFIAVPAPSGPEGLAFMPVLAGLAIPETAPNPDGARELIRHLTEGQTQAVTLQEVGFYPVIENDIPVDLPPGIGMQMEAVTQQAAAPDALPSLLPVGLGERGGEFNRVFFDAFEAIVLRGDDPQQVLEQQAGILEEIMEDTGAPCWEPDPPSAPDPCPVGG